MPRNALGPDRRMTCARKQTGVKETQKASQSHLYPTFFARSDPALGQTDRSEILQSIYCSGSNGNLCAWSESASVRSHILYYHGTV